mgnify:CR=1 FL=1
MSDIFVHHRIACRPREWSAITDRLSSAGAERISELGGVLYGLWRSQIGLPRDTVTAISVWPDTDAAVRLADLLHDDDPDVDTVELDLMSPTLRPESAEPPRRQGNYAFRWFETSAENFVEFLRLCEAAWPGFESSYDSQVIGLWRVEGNDEGPIRTLLITRRPNLAMWERSKQPANAAEAAVRKKLSQRYDLCDWTTVYTTTLLTAEDNQDTVRWS